jgi:hypothetical protein
MDLDRGKNPCLHELFQYSILQPFLLFFPQRAIAALVGLCNSSNLEFLLIVVCERISVALEREPDEANYRQGNGNTKGIC